MSTKNKFDITQVVKENLCHSCGACFASCGHDSIDFKETIGGYNIPIIDYDSCTNCGLCFDVCSGDHFGKTLTNNIPENHFVGNIISTHVGKATDKRIFDNSQSGGITTSILANLLNSNEIEVALVAIMKEGIPPRGDFALVNSSQELYACQKSKYTPISLLSAIPLLKKVKGKIAIVGLSCHFHSLQNLCDTYSWLAKKDILKIGLICDRVMTATAIDFISLQATNNPVNNFIFRDKLKPSYPGNSVVFSNDSEFVLDASIRMNMKDFFTPARCRLCFDKLNIFSDLVMGDPHGIADIDKKHGETLVFTRTIKGKEILEKSNKANVINIRTVNTQVAINGQKIEKKIIDFNKFTAAWSSLNRKLPNYPFEIESVNSFLDERIKLEHSLNLDKFNSREELLSYAQKYYKKLKYKSLKDLIFKKIKSIIKKILNKGN